MRTANTVSDIKAEDTCTWSKVGLACLGRGRWVTVLWMSF